MVEGKLLNRAPSVAPGAFLCTPYACASGAPNSSLPLKHRPTRLWFLRFGSWLMQRLTLLVLVVVVLVACGGRSVPTTAQVTAKLSAAGAVNFRDYGLDMGGIITFTYQFDFVHLVDKTRKAGYAWLRLNDQEEVSHARPARCDYTRPAVLRTRL